MRKLQRIFVTGDLNVDLVSLGVAIGAITRVQHSKPVLGGSAYNAAQAFASRALRPSVFGKVGNDPVGDLLLASLRERDIECFIEQDREKPTCTCNIVYHRESDQRTIYYWEDNANDYDVSLLREVVERIGLSSDDLAFLPLHIYDQTDRDRSHCRKFFDVLRSTGARIIVDIVPHRIYEVLDLKGLREIIGGPVFWIIGELRTFMKLAAPDRELPQEGPSFDDCMMIGRALAARYFSCRFGVGNISRDVVFQVEAGQVTVLGPPRETGYESVPDVEKRGFGDRLTANTLVELLSRESCEGIESDDTHTH